MKLSILELGELKGDVQHEILDFDGDLSDYLYRKVTEIYSRPDLDLISSASTDNGRGIVLDYFCFPSNKRIRHIAIEVNELAS